MEGTGGFSDRLQKKEVDERNWKRWKFLGKGRGEEKWINGEWNVEK